MIPCENHNRLADFLSRREISIYTTANSYKYWTINVVNFNGILLFEKYSFHWGILSVRQISAAYTSMHVFPFENGRNEKTMSYLRLTAQLIQPFCYLEDSATYDILSHLVKEMPLRFLKDGIATEFSDGQIYSGVELTS